LTTIAVDVRYNNILRSTAGIAEETLQVPTGASLVELLRVLGHRHGSGLNTMLFQPDGTVATHLVVFRNRKLVGQDQYSLQLADGDELNLFPAVSGG
jgi:molybdopterin converting factor small subunit